MEPALMGQQIGFTYLGLKIFIEPTMTELKEDWSKVRSPSRARRRLKHGFKQNITSYSVPSKAILKDKNGSLFMHPNTWEAMKDALVERAKRSPVVAQPLYTTSQYPSGYVMLGAKSIHAAERRRMYQRKVVI